MFPTHKVELFIKGKELADRFCQVNNIPLPEVKLWGRRDWHVNACAYYRPDTEMQRKWGHTGINVCVQECASPCTQAQTRNWNWPANITDREPFGVVSHELGHHCDWLASEKKSSYGGDYSVSVMKESGEPPITSYAPNPWEWFAEIFRLYVTNPDLLQAVRPRAYAIIARRWQPAVTLDWKGALGCNVPERIVKNLRKKGAV